MKLLVSVAHYPEGQEPKGPPPQYRYEIHEIHEDRGEWFLVLPADQRIVAVVL